MKWMSLTALHWRCVWQRCPVLFSRRETAVQPVTQMEMQQEMKPVTVQQTQQAAPMENSSDDQPEPFRILDRSTGKVQTVPVQVYVTGALCSEMPGYLSQGGTQSAGGQRAYLGAVLSKASAAERAAV